VVVAPVQHALFFDLAVLYGTSLQPPPGIGIDETTQIVRNEQPDANLTCDEKFQQNILSEIVQNFASRTKL
jgi:hypothetical protein